MLVVSQPLYRPKLCHYSFDRALNRGYTNLQQQEICIIFLVIIVGIVVILHELIVRLTLGIKFKVDKQGTQMESCRELGTCQAEY